MGCHSPNSRLHPCPHRHPSDSSLPKAPGWDQEQSLSQPGLCRKGQMCKTGVLSCE